MSGGGMAKAVQYWFSIVIVPASTVSSMSWSSRTCSSVRATQLLRDAVRGESDLVDPGDDGPFARRQRCRAARRRSGLDAARAGTPASSASGRWAARQ